MALNLLVDWGNQTAYDEAGDPMPLSDLKGLKGRLRVALLVPSMDLFVSVFEGNDEAAMTAHYRGHAPRLAYLQPEFIRDPGVFQVWGLPQAAVDGVFKDADVELCVPYQAAVREAVLRGASIAADGSVQGANLIVVERIGAGLAAITPVHGWQVKGVRTVDIKVARTALKQALVDYQREFKEKPESILTSIPGLVGSDLREIVRENIAAQALAAIDPGKVPCFTSNLVHVRDAENRERRLAAAWTAAAVVAVLLAAAAWGWQAVARRSATAEGEELAARIAARQTELAQTVADVFPAYVERQKAEGGDFTGFLAWFAGQAGTALTVEDLVAKRPPGGRGIQFESWLNAAPGADPREVSAGVEAMRRLVAREAPRSSVALDFSKDPAQVAFKGVYAQ